MTHEYDRKIHVGYQMHSASSGDPVSIPLKHLAITGQTQEAGKTTALDALARRSGRRTLVFLTKRGEGAFESANYVQPYFRDQGHDWQFVASILEASRKEKLKFERAWIIRASRGAKTLADVQRNVKTAMKTAKGLSADVYLTLDAYLDVVVPTINAIDWAPKLRLADPLNSQEGSLNVMDLRDVPDEMQHLIITSALEYVLHFEKDTIVVIPEAWKFIPQGRNTPVKLAAASYIRQGAALHNYLWLDSQDIGGIEKEILRSVVVWMVGVQRETNEVKRVLDNIPAGAPRPKEKDIATLTLGEFYVCYGQHAIRTYVQPWWASDIISRRWARGEVPDPPRRKEGEEVYDEEKARLIKQLDDRDRRIASLVERVQQLENRLRDREADENAAPASHIRSQHGVGVSGRVDGTDVPGAVRDSVHESYPAREANLRTEDLYQILKKRFVDEAPAILKILIARPEVHVTIERPTFTFEPSSLKGRLVRLMVDGFFAGERRTNSGIRSELKRKGPDANTANIGRAMDEFVAMGLFTDEGASGYQIVDGVQAKATEATA